MDQQKMPDENTMEIAFAAIVIKVVVVGNRLYKKKNSLSCSVNRFFHREKESQNPKRTETISEGNLKFFIHARIKISQNRNVILLQICFST